MGIDYSPRYKDYALFLPAISEMAVRWQINKNPKREPPISREDMNFLSDQSPIFYIPYALYSAGQAAKSATAAKKRDCMITGRDRTKTHTFINYKNEKTTIPMATIVGDSGGYQIQTTAIKFKGDETREMMMRWLEGVTDWSMVLDFPTGGINLGNVEQHTSRLIAEGYDVHEFCQSLGFDPGDMQKIGYATCLMQTMQNNDYFVKHRVPDATQFLNVIQGRNVTESDIWYEKVKHYPFEGWSLAGQHKENFEMMMKRLITMRDDGLLENKNWLHVLGVGRLEAGCAYTTMQRCIRESVNPKFQISYDVSSPFTLAAYGKLFFGYTLSKSAWSLHGDKIDGREFLPGGARAKTPFLEFIKENWDAKGLKTIEQGGFGTFVETEVGKRLTMDQMCVNVDLKFTSTWDVTSYMYGMIHNLQVLLEGIFHAQDLYDHGDVKLVPNGMLVLKDLIPRIFASETPLDMIAKHRKELNYLAGDTAEGGVAALELFDMSSVKSHYTSLDKMNISNKSPIIKMEAACDLFNF